MHALLEYGWRHGTGKLLDDENVRWLRRLGTVRALGGLVAEAGGSEVSIVDSVVLFDQDGRQALLKHSEPR